MAPITSAIRRQMTDEGACVTADRDEFRAVCDAVDAIHARKLKALDASTRRVDELCSENERLRGLVRDMWNGMCGYAHDCRSCEHYELYEGQRFVGECEYHRRMRELGIEVDE